MNENDVNQQPTTESLPPEVWPDGAGELRVAPERDDETLVLDLDGFEGPLDLLLDLARHHKIDLTRISILQLVDQYLAFIDRARNMRLEFAADYLVMAAWLAYLKSRLLIPGAAPTGEGEPADMAARLAFRLQRLQAMRNSANSLMHGPQLGRDVFMRGAPEPLVVQKQTLYGDTLIDLLKAYAERRTRSMVRQTYTIHRQPTWSIKEAREALERLMGALDTEWGTFDSWLEHYLAKPETRRSVRASSFTASLELAREGTLELRQDHAFQPIFLRRRMAPAA